MRILQIETRWLTQQVLKEMVEGKKNASTKAQGYKLSGNVGQEAQGAYMEMMAKPLALSSMQGEGEEEKAAKPMMSPKTKLPVAEMRLKKIAADLMAARTTLKAMEDGQVKYCLEIKADFKKQVDVLMKASALMHQAGLMGSDDEVTSAWEEAKPALRELKAWRNFMEATLIFICFLVFHMII